MNDRRRKGPEACTSGTWPADADPNAEIGAKLRALYSSLQQEPIPERFLDLLDRLDESERKSTARPHEA